MNNLALFFAGSILVTIGIIVLSIGVIVINNLLHRYWKPVTVVKYDYQPVYFDPATGQEVDKKKPKPEGLA